MQRSVDVRRQCHSKLKKQPNAVGVLFFWDERQVNFLEQRMVQENMNREVRQDTAGLLAPRVVPG